MSDSQWPVFPALGTNFSFLGLKHLYSEGQRGVESPVGNRGSGEFRFTRFTNDFTMSTNFTWTNFSGETPVVFTVSRVHTNYTRSNEEWEAELVIENFTEGTNGFWVEVNYKPNDENGFPVAPGYISLGNDTNGNPVYLDGEWNTLLLAGDCTTNKLKPTLDEAVKTADGAPSAIPLWTTNVLSTSGQFSGGNLLGSNPGMAPLFTNATPALGGPQLMLTTNTTKGVNSISHAVEFSALIPGNIPLASCTFTQICTFEKISVFVNNQLAEALSFKTPMPPGGDPDFPLQATQYAGPGRTIFMVDTPGAPISLFGYFDPNCQVGPFPPGTFPISAVQLRQEFVTWVEFMGKPMCKPVKWYSEVNFHSADSVSTSAGYLPE